MPRLIGAVLARNEASRFLTPVLTALVAVCDTVLLLDDGSTDDTPKIAADLGCAVKKRDSGAMWGREAPARKELWDWAVSKCGTDDWVLICDADQELVGDPRPLMETWESNTVNLRLYDCWSPTEYRCDGYWQGHLYPRPWMVCPKRVPEGWTAEWPVRGIHCGHLPTNWPTLAPIHDPNLYWIHRAYQSPELRKAKYDAYMAQSAQLSPFELQHAASILDPL